MYKMLNLPDENSATCLDFKGSYLVIGREDGRLTFYVLKENMAFKKIYEIKISSCSISCLTMTGKNLAAVARDRKLRLFDLRAEPPELISTLFLTSEVGCISFLPQNLKLCTGGTAFTFWMDAGSSHFTPYKIMMLPQGSAVSSMIYSPDGEFLVCGTSDGNITAWPSAEKDIGQLTYVPNAHKLSITTCALASLAVNGTESKEFLLATGSCDTFVKVWKVISEGKFKIFPIKTCVGHTNPICSVKFRGDSEVLMSIGNDMKICFWDTVTGMLKYENEASESYSQQVACCYIGFDAVASVSSDKKVLIWAIPPFRVSEKLKRCLKNKKISQWDTYDVAAWMHELGFPQYVIHFMDNEVDGKQLQCMTVDRLQNELGIIIEHCMHIMRALRLRILSELPEAESECPVAESYPDEFLCPITRQIMEIPAVAQDGNTYESEVIRRWFIRGFIRSPMTNLPLTCCRYYFNRTLLALIRKYQV